MFSVIMRNPKFCKPFLERILGIKISRIEYSKSQEMIEKFILQEKDADEVAKNEGTTDIGAVRLWKSYSDETKEMWLHNAFCINCGNASFRPGYNLRKDKLGLVIEGICDKCEGRIVRCCD